MTKKKIHPLEKYRFWGTREQNFKPMYELYDRLTANMSEQQVKELEELIEWVRVEKSLNDDYDRNGD